MIMRYLFPSTVSSLSDIGLRMTYFVELLLFVGLFLIIEDFSRRSLLVSFILLSGGLVALVPGLVYIWRNDPVGAVIDIPFLLLYIIEPLPILLFLWSLPKRIRA